MNKEIIFIFDHDGTWTDPVKTHHAFTPVFEREFSTKTGIPKYVIHEHMEAARKEIIANPKIYSWERDGYRIAPATVDTFVLNNVAAGMAISSMRESGERRFPQDAAETDKFIPEIYAASYPQVQTFYRKETARTVRELHPLGRVVIVSNSNANHLLGRINAFLAESNIPQDAVAVVGDARKYTVTPDWDKVPKYTHFPGQPRLIHLRRGYYGAVLSSLGQKPFIVVGDSGEMDLALPEALGCQTLLIGTPFSVPWELNHFENVTSLDHVTGRIMQDLGR